MEDAIKLLIGNNLKQLKKSRKNLFKFFKRSANEFDHKMF